MATTSSTAAQASVESAEAAGLRYVTDRDAGLRRRRRGKGFIYVDASGATVRDGETLGRVRALAIPPAWSDVWICSDPRGHIQAVGRDARRRRQYRYHPRWRAVRDESKYERLLDFGRVLPGIRRQVQRDLRRPGLPREKILATVIKLLETTLIRVGNAEYAKENQSFGLTTLRNKHVEVSGEAIHFEFRGKSGIQHSVDLHDRRLAAIIRACQHLPGQELFQYVDAAGGRHAIGSDDVNAYLQSVAGAEFTAKDFRTWAGTVLAAAALGELGGFDSQSRGKANIVVAIESVARRLGNTKAICRKCYVHPAVLAAYLEGAWPPSVERRVAQTTRSTDDGLRPEEAVVMTILRRLAREARRTGVVKTGAGGRRAAA